MSTHIQNAAGILHGIILRLAYDDPFSAYSLRRLATIYLITAHLYYEYDESLLPDHVFDHLCKYLSENSERMLDEGVWHLSLIDKEALDAGTGYQVAGRCPITIQNIASAMLRKPKSKRK